MFLQGYSHSSRTHYFSIETALHVICKLHSKQVTQLLKVNKTQKPFLTRRQGTPSNLDIFRPIKKEYVWQGFSVNKWCNTMTRAFVYDATKNILEFCSKIDMYCQRLIIVVAFTCHKWMLTCTIESIYTHTSFPKIFISFEKDIPDILHGFRLK